MRTLSNTPASEPRKLYPTLPVLRGVDGGIITFSPRRKICFFLPWAFRPAALPHTQRRVASLHALTFMSLKIKLGCNLKTCAQTKPGPAEKPRTRCLDRLLYLIQACLLSLSEDSHCSASFSYMMLEPLNTSDKLPHTVSLTDIYTASFY